MTTDSGYLFAAMTQLMQDKPAPPLTELQPKLYKRGFLSFAFDGQYKFARYYAPDDFTGEQQKQMAQSTTQNPEAYQLYLKGRNSLHKRGADNINQSVALFKLAIAADPAYAPAYAALADAYNIAPSWTGMSEHEAATQSLTTAHKALELNPQLGDAHAALAAALVDSFRWAEAEKEFRRALELEPNTPNSTMPTHSCIW
jgi:tetratricopeptide (TPR) repeat protein